MIKFWDILGRYKPSKFNQTEAGELLGISEWTFRRSCQRCEEGGEAGLSDRRLGKASGKRVPADRADGVGTPPAGATAASARGTWCATISQLALPWTKAFLQSKGVLGQSDTRGAHRLKRQRRLRPDMMLHQDGSRHAWLSGLDAMDLIVTLDDATGKIYSVFLVPEEGTASTFRDLWDWVSALVLALSIYTDRDSHYFHTPEVADKVDRKTSRSGTPWRTSASSTFRCISPLARGRSERMSQTLQDRPSNELALAGIATVDAANAYIRDVDLPVDNARFAVRSE